MIMCVEIQSVRQSNNQLLDKYSTFGTNTLLYFVKTEYKKTKISYPCLLCCCCVFTCPGALGWEGLDRGGSPTGESQERCGVHTRGNRGADDQTSQTEGRTHLPSKWEQVVHTHQGERQNTTMDLTLMGLNIMGLLSFSIDLFSLLFPLTLSFDIYYVTISSKSTYSTL